MDLDSQVPSGPDLSSASAPVQLAALAAAIGGVLLASVLVVAAAGWMARRRRRAEEGSPFPAAGHAAAASGWTSDPTGGGESSRDGFCGEIAAIVRLAVVPVLAVFLLPAAAAVRQLWPHPDLGWRMIAGWFGALLPVAVIWIIFCGRSTGKPRA